MADAAGERPRCRGVKRDGMPCPTTLGLSAAGLCLAHDPERIEEVRRVRSQGGVKAGESRRARRDAIKAIIPDDIPPAPKNLEDATRYFAWITHAVTAGRLDARTGHEAAYALNGFKAAAEKRDLEREIKKLREELAEARKQQRAARIA